MNIPLLKSLDAEDVFISYSRLDGNAYVTGLDAALSAAGLTCFSDKRGTDANPLLPEMLYRRIELCKTFVLIGTRGAMSKPGHIATEIEVFAKANGTSRIIPISFDRGRDADDWSTAMWYSAVVGKSRERELPETLTTGQPSKEIVARIEVVSDYMKSKDRLRMYRNRALTGFVVLFVGAVASAGAAIMLSSRASRANDQAVRQQTIAEARALSNRSQSLLRQRPDALRQAIGLAIDGMAKANSVGARFSDIDNALRESLALVPSPIATPRTLPGGLDATALSPNAVHLATLESGTLCIYSVRDPGVPTKQMTIPKSGILAINNDASVAVVAQNDETIAVIHLANATTTRIGIPAGVSEYEVKRLALSPRGRYVAAIVRTDLRQDHFDTEELSIIVWDAATGAELHRAVEDTLKPHAIAFSGSGDLVAAGAARLRSQYSGYNGRVMVWPFSGTRRIKKSDFLNPQVFDIPDEVRAIALGNDHVFATETSIWRRDALGTYQRTSRFALDPGDHGKAGVAFGPEDNAIVVLRSKNGRLHLHRWDVGDHRDEQHRYLEHRLTTIAFDGTTTVADSARAARFTASRPANGGVVVHDALNAKDTSMTFKPPLDMFDSYTVEVSPDGQRLITIGEKTARLWDIATGNETTPTSLRELCSGGTVARAKFSNSSAYLSVVVWHDPSEDLKDFAPETIPEDVCTIRLADGKTVHRASYTQAATSIVFSARDQYLLISAHDLVTTLVSLNNPTDEKRAHNDDAVAAAAFSADEKMFVTGSESGMIQLFRIEDPELDLVRLRDSGTITAVAFSSDGKRLASTSERQNSVYEEPTQNHVLRVWLLDPAAVVDDAKRRLARYDGRMP